MFSQCGGSFKSFSPNESLLDGGNNHLTLDLLKNLEQKIKKCFRGPKSKKVTLSKTRKNIKRIVKEPSVLLKHQQKDHLLFGVFDIQEPFTVGQVAKRRRPGRCRRRHDLSKSMGRPGLSPVGCLARYTWERLGGFSCFNFLKGD